MFFLARVFLPFALGYFLSHLFRSVNAVVSADLVAELGLDAWTVGFLTSAYFLTFAGAQLPIGIALDRWGPRRTESLLLLFAAAGAVVFGRAETTVGLVAGRALIGLGVSACLMASFHVFALWAPPARLPFWNGAVMTAGAAGSIAATTPVEWAVAGAGWRQLFLALGLMGLLGALFLHLVAPEKRLEMEGVRLSEIALGLGSVFRSRVFWSIAPLSVAHQGAYLAIQGLWAGPWLRDVAGQSREEVAVTLLLLAVGMGVGYLGLGYLAARFTPLTVWMVSALAFQLTQIHLVLGWTSRTDALWFLFGLAGASGMLSYGIVTRHFPVSMAGRVNTALNVLVFTGAFGVQAGMGAFIQWWSPEGSAFSPGGYQAAFALVLGAQVACALWLLLTRGWRAAPPPYAN